MEYGIMHIYRNPAYSGYETTMDCFVIYIKNAGIFMTTENESFRILQKPSENNIDEDTIDSYTELRGFEKVLTFDNKDTIIWYNGYQSESNRKIVKDYLLRLRLFIKYYNKSTVLLPLDSSYITYVYTGILYDKLSEN